ncbi:MAG: radical SAM protein [Acidobacteriia bacterium]|nr:radical SAM protein [Terriglobia bacterium]
MKSVSELFAVPVPDSWVVIAPLHGVSARVNGQAVAVLAGAGGRTKNGSVAQLAELFDSPAAPAPEPRQGPISPQFLGLITTRSCNMNCGYCNFGALTAPQRHMDPNVAVTAIDWMADLAAREGRRTLDVHLFGGEPFLAGDVVDVIVHRTRIAASARGLEPVLEAATNGACSEWRARFAGEYFSAIVLSLDGPAGIHDLHRPFRDGTASFQAVERTARILADAAADLNLRVCVSQRNVESLASIAAWMAKEFRPSAIDFEPLRPTAEAVRAGLFPPDPYRFAEAFMEAHRAASEMGVRVTYSASDRVNPRICFCPLGNDAVIVETDGSLHACYLDKREWAARELDLHLGAAVPGEGMRLDERSVERVRRLAVPPPRCSACFCRYWCAGGCHVNGYGNSQSGYDDFCVQTRLITIACLLHRLQAAPTAGALLSDRSAARGFALRLSDRIADWESPS